MEPTTQPECLEVRDPNGQSSLVKLTGARTIIGRSEDAGLRLDHPAVSRHHAELYRDPFGRWWVHDLKSRNGTRLDGKPVAESVVPFGNEIAIGPFAIRIRPSVGLTTTSTASTTSAPVRDAGVGDVRSLTDVKPARVSGEHLQIRAHFSRQLGEMPDEMQRLFALCSLVVSPELRGHMAVIVRVKREDPSDAEIVSGPACGAGWECRVPYVSRAMVRALLGGNQPVFGGPAGGGLELTVVDELPRCAAMACPLGADETCVEFLYALLPPEYGTGEWLSLVSLAVEEYRQSELAWLARRGSEDHVRIEHDLERARDIQRRLIPHSLAVPGLDVAIGFQPCRWVGGDYVDVLPLRDGRAFLAIADVCGKGLQAALVASALHSRVHAGIDAGLDAVGVMQGVNHYLHEFLPPDSFVTMCSMTVDARSGEIQIVNAGHLAPIVREASGRLREVESGQNPPLRVTDTLECGRDRLAPGDLLALFTDGLVESGEDRNLDTGVAQLRDKLGAADARSGVSTIADGLMASLGAASGEATASDDCTLLLARRTV